jgi:hypothetical protein
MREPFIGSEALAAGTLTRHAVRSRFLALYPDVYVPKDIELTAIQRAQACWLWSQRRGVLAGFSAAALHGAKWIDPRWPAEIFHRNRHRPPRLRTYADRVADDEVEVIRGMRVTTPARTALDLGSRYPLDKAVAALDSLARATDLKLADAELIAARYAGRRGIRQARRALTLFDGGAESPRETWLRLLLVGAGFPRPQTQIPVFESGWQIARLDMGWEDIRVAAEYDGDYHWMDRRRFNDDIHRMEVLAELGWIVVRVTAGDCEADIIRRMRTAFERARRA